MLSLSSTNILGRRLWIQTYTWFCFSHLIFMKKIISLHKLHTYISQKNRGEKCVYVCQYVPETKQICLWDNSRNEYSYMSKWNKLASSNYWMIEKFYLQGHRCSLERTCKICQHLENFYQVLFDYFKNIIHINWLFFNCFLFSATEHQC